MKSLSMTDYQLIDNIVRIHEYYLEKKCIKLLCYNALYSVKTRNI